jgi:hypothetical protein
METFIIFLVVFAIISLLYYQLQKRIGEDQAAKWADFVKANPQYFKKPDAPVTKDSKCRWPDDEKKNS